MKAWTDYPFTQLGDTPGMRAPVREIEVVEYDDDKYCVILIHSDDGSIMTSEIKSGYIYQKPGRFGDVPGVTKDQLATLVPNPIRTPDGEVK
jgi:hypothetical protein